MVKILAMFLKCEPEASHWKGIKSTNLVLVDSTCNSCLNKSLVVDERNLCFNSINCVNHISSYRSYKTRKSVMFGCNIKPSNQSIYRVFVFDIRVLDLIKLQLFSDFRVLGYLAESTDF